MTIMIMMMIIIIIMINKIIMILTIVIQMIIKMNSNVRKYSKKLSSNINVLQFVVKDNQHTSIIQSQYQLKLIKIVENYY